MKKSIFRSQKTQEAFEKWVGGPLGPNYHPCDDERFYSFVNIYFKENEHVEKDAFVKAAKKHHQQVGKISGECIRNIMVNFRLLRLSLKAKMCHLKCNLRHGRIPVVKL